MRKPLVVAAAVLAACLTPSLALAQRHSGAWISGGGGVGWATVHCDANCEDEDANAALVLFIDGGIALSEKLLIGAEFNSWSKNIETGTTDRSLRLNGLLATVLFYPSDTSGIFVKGGFGISYANISGTTAFVNPDLGAGTGITYGVGYDIPIGRSVYLTPAVGLQHGFLGDAVEIVGVPAVRGWRHDIFQFTVGLTIQ
jgi:outer membrane protein with beta-barrel domain